MISIEKPYSPSELVHFGKKGMKWGVRKAYINSVENRAAQQRRVGSGKGSTGDKIRVGLTTSGNSFARARKRGVNAATERAIRSEEHIKRMKDGKATTHDTLRMIGSLTPRDIADGMRATPSASAQRQRGKRKFTTADKVELGVAGVLVAYGAVTLAAARSM